MSEDRKGKFSGKKSFYVWKTSLGTEQFGKSPDVK